MWTMLLMALVGLIAIAYDAAREHYCVCCWRPFAVFAVRGRLGMRQVCRRCWRAHHRRARGLAR
jgi:hypothetical protein